MGIKIGGSAAAVHLLYFVFLPVEVLVRGLLLGEMCDSQNHTHLKLKRESWVTLGGPPSCSDTKSKNDTLHRRLQLKSETRRE